MKRHLIRTLSLTAVLALFMAALSASFVFAGAERNVGNTDIFNASNAENISGEEGAEYLTYRLNGDDNSVTFRRNLALKWYTAEAENSVAGAENYFSLSLGFVSPTFETFTIALETSQFSMSKEGKTTNELTFTRESDGSYSVVVNGNPAAQTLSSVEAGSFTVSLGDDDTNGSFAVYLNNTELTPAETSGEAADGADTSVRFNNIGKYYAQYSASTSSDPRTPLTFSATFAEGAEGAEFEIRSMNGQDFDLTDGEVTDDTAPVLVVNSDIRRIYYGTEISFDTVTIDVCTSSGITTDEYYYDGTDAEKDPENTDATLDYGNRVYGALDSNTIFFPDDFTDASPQVSFAYHVKDGSGDSANDAVYLVEWSAEDVLNPDNADEFFIPVMDANDEDSAPATTFITYDAGSQDNKITEDSAAIDAYQKAVEEASWKKDENGDYVLKEDGSHESIQVGAGAYFYVPAFKQYIEDISCGYTDMEFTVYYRTESSSTVNTVTGSYDELRIELTEEGRYQFRIVPTNSAGNAMVGVFASGPDDSVYTEGDITSSNVFEAKNIPTFEFRVEYTGPYIETPEDEEDTGYVDVTYSVSDFEIIGIADSYTTLYRLYYFEANSSAAITAAQLREADAASESNTSNSLGNWVAISQYDSELDADEGQNVYSWDPESSLSFIPQERGFYRVEVYVATNNMGIISEAKYIEVSADARVIPGDTYWLENNILSLVFLGIGILCLVGIVVILLIKPKNKAEAGAENVRKAELKEKREKRK